MYQTTNQQKSTDEKRPLEVDHEEQQDKVQETTCQHAFFRRPPGGHPLLFRRNPSGTTHQVPNPEDGSAPRVLPANSTSSKAETRTSAVTSEAPTTEDAEVNNSNVRTGQKNLKVVTTTPAAENATPDSSNVGITAPTIEDVAAQNTNVKTEATPKTEDVAANNSNVGTQTLATENATLDSSNVVVEKSIVEEGAPDNPNVETGVPASEEVVPNNPNMRRRHSGRVTDESSQNFDTEGSTDDITSTLTKMLYEKVSRENNAGKTEEKEVKGKSHSQSASVKCWFCFCYAEE
ncbi:uncharacterized protein [Coffea arabica]|uniref:Uncharacterized protein isoform X2 n=1 Tax=Coffea arabica TaxID=13443 RepID=A0A6P6WWK8_COFAR|nr:uncharacterized protein LOC113736821 isoform X2 [Coffea arabica]